MVDSSDIDETSKVSPTLVRAMGLEVTRNLGVNEDEQLSDVLFIEQ